MIISLDFFGLDDGAIFDSRGGHSSYFELESTDGLLDQLYMDNDTTIDNSATKADNFTYKTIMNAKFSGDLEAGSVNNKGREIDRIRFQKRRSDELYWTDVAELEYDYPNKKLYEALDKYIQNDFEYEYSLLPITNEVLGSRVISETIQADFEGYFLSDKDNNYQFYLNAEMGNIEHVTNSSLTTTLNGKYPIVTYGNLDYRQGSLQAIILTDKDVEFGTITINEEKQLRDKLLFFLKSRKPKILRGMNGELMLITIISNPTESPNNNRAGISEVSFDYVEIDEINSESLRNNGLIEGLSEV